MVSSCTTVGTGTGSAKLKLSNAENTIGRLVDDLGNVVVNTSVIPKEVSNLDYIQELDVPFPLDPTSGCCILSYTGALVRLYFYDGVWNLSTHNKIDAFQSYWNNDKSFGEIFVEHMGDIDAFAERLDRKLVYTYIVREQINPHEQKVLFAGAYPLGSEQAQCPRFDVDAATPYHVPRLFPTSIDELTAFVRVLNKHKIQGVLLFHHNEVHRIYAPGYRADRLKLRMRARACR
jgi:hypothetical protein